jgi:hypothetical protein
MTDLTKLTTYQLLIEYGNTVATMRDYERDDATHRSVYKNLYAKCNALEDEAERRDKAGKITWELDNAQTDNCGTSV